MVRCTKVFVSRGVDMLPLKRRFIDCCVILLIWSACCCGAEGRNRAEALRRWDLQELSKTPQVQWLDDQSPIQSLLLEGESFNGKPTNVFAYFSTPARLQRKPESESDLPGIVLLHGGGGTAFSHWVQMWVDRGYAAIALDLGGKRPKAPEFDPKTGRIYRHYDFQREDRLRLERGGPLDDHDNKILNVDGELGNDWQFHAVSAAIRAHSFLRSLPEVDPEKTAVTGISWGGYLTCMTASVDPRFKAAVPVYGCGFLYDGESVQRASIERNTARQLRQWVAYNDPSSLLPYCKVPIFFVNGTNDKHYPLRSYSRSYSLVPGEKAIRIEVGMQHSHQAGWKPAEIQRFIDHKLLGKPGLCEIVETAINNRNFSARLAGEVKAKSAKLQFTRDDGALVSRRWLTVPAAVEGDIVSARVPDGATIWCLAIVDELGGMISTDVVFSDSVLEKR